jgi:hypothetical protein
MKRVPYFSLIVLIILSLLSLGIHNHGFCFDSSSAKKVFHSNSAYPNESKDNCPACCLYGNFNLHNTINPLDYSFLKIVVATIEHDDLILSSTLTSKKFSRSPPKVI